jgi:hypothetical protein
MGMRLWMAGSTYQDIVVPSGPGTTYYDIPSSMIALQVNGTSVPANTYTAVQLPDLTTVYVRWDGLSNLTITLEEP